jgi:CTP synthase (UTP-ammonia lyase)
VLVKTSSDCCICFGFAFWVTELIRNTVVYFDATRQNFESDIDSNVVHLFVFITWAYTTSSSYAESSSPSTRTPGEAKHSLCRNTSDKEEEEGG